MKVDEQISEIERERVYELLALNFPWREDVAQRYLDDTLMKLPQMNYQEIAKRNSGELLEEILDRQVRQSGKNEIVIPLSGGWDSRGLLGAALRIFDKHRIHAISVGNDNFREVKFAKSICKKNDVYFTQLNPDTDVEWDMDLIVSTAAKVYEQMDGYITPDWCIITNEIDNLAGGNAVIVSGFIGDSVAGAKLNEEYIDINNTLDDFFKKNKTPFANHIDWKETDKFQKAKNFISCNWDVLVNIPGIVPIDILDFAFRQGIWIKGAVTGVHKNVISPYNDPLWFAHWFGGSIERRVKKNGYMDMITNRYPEVMPSKIVVTKNKIDSVYRKLFLTKKSNIPKSILERGDPNKNDSMRFVLEESVKSFDERELIDMNIYNKLKELLDKTNKNSYSVVMSAVNAEVHLRAGTLH